MKGNHGCFFLTNRRWIIGAGSGAKLEFGDVGVDRITYESVNVTILLTLQLRFETDI